MTGEIVDRVELWLPVERLGSRGTLVRGTDTEGNSVISMVLRADGAGVEVVYQPKRGAQTPVTAIVPLNNIRLVTLAVPEP